MNAQYVWALLGVLCLAIMFAMMAIGIRTVKNEPLDVDPHDAEDEGVLR